MRIGLVVPHIFMQDTVLPHVIFSPGVLAKQLAEGLQAVGHEVFLFTPGPLTTSVHNITSDMTLFEAELAARGDSAVSLLKKHPLTFITLSRQLQAELIAKAYKMANEDQLDIVHIYTNEEELALPFAPLCHKPVVFTHHDPFNFLVRYRAVMPKYAGANWLSLSFAQRQTMPKGTHWIANIYHGLDPKSISIGKPDTNNPYILFLGRIIEAKGLHLAIKAVQLYNKTAAQPLRLKIAGKHYAGQKDRYWQSTILPLLQDPHIEYMGFVGDQKHKNKLLAEAQALIIPSTFAEPFGMVMIESLAAGTPVVGLDSGAISEIVKDGHTGLVVSLKKQHVGKNEVVDEHSTVQSLAKALEKVETINRKDCRSDFEARFTRERMVNDHIAAYKKLVK